MSDEIGQQTTAEIEAAERQKAINSYGKILGPVFYELTKAEIDSPDNLESNDALRDHLTGLVDKSLKSRHQEERHYAVRAIADYSAIPRKTRLTLLQGGKRD